MSEDARNSIYLWVGGIAFALLLWAALKFGFTDLVPRWVVEAEQGLLLLVFLFRFGLWLWRRHAKRSEMNV